MSVHTSGRILGNALLVLALVAPVAVEAAAAQGDSVPSNLWLTRSMMEDLAEQCAQTLGPQHHRILLVPGDAEAGTELFEAAAHGVLRDRDHDVFLAGADSTGDPAVDVQWYFRVVGVELAYPQVGRTLGIWRSWIAREIGVTVLCTITESSGGRILMDDQLRLQMADRFPADDYSHVDSPLYEFTTAEPVNGNWHDRLEEVVVLGTLAGLVAVYFANTSN
ncbi:hypothetical protein CO151_01150 [bacterium CG_4_9_14_3_um_filter_65_15]|nr:MAG: hypothetical protein CO151_01150 [bacterium CG_4_9_14_3_um_filter_65_15]